ncbi:MAG: hypothetical protein CVV47_07645 [Spirochaetae bacterium HGW-Spirochaetae-3]|jgi:hypothetical protein|nr:MAG: hypothetical protein CVV47_07645 [Spirochaetae bacterium HGW-Spirochaetae-3]
MGLRGELFSTRIACDGRTYFFNVKENRMGDLFLAIVESKPTETGDFDRRSIVIFQDNADEFIKAFQKSLEAMKEAAPSERVKPPRTKRDAMAPRDDGRETMHRLTDDERPRHYIDTGRPRGADPRPARAEGASRSDGASRDVARRASVRGEIDRATGRSSRGPNDDRRSGESKPAGKGRVLRVKPKAAAKAIPPAVKKPAAKRLTVKKVAPKKDE